MKQIRPKPPLPGELILCKRDNYYWLVLSSRGCGKAIMISLMACPLPIGLTEEAVTKYLLSDEICRKGEDGWQPPSSEIIQLADKYLAKYGCDTPAATLPTYDLKTENSKPERTKCFSCSGELKEPYPGIKFCPKCEK